MPTNSFNEIGGYFGLEAEDVYNNSSDTIKLNCARNCLRYVIQSFKIKELYFPYYTCPVVWQAAKKENCKINFYHIDENLMPIKEFSENDFIVYTNYFGICAKNVKRLTQKYKNLIVDNAQAFYMPRFGIASFNSLRKFFGVPDGAFLHTDKRLDSNFEKEISYNKCDHLLKRIDVSAQFGYEDFCKNDENFIDADIKLMSKLSEQIFSQINLDKAKDIRLKNFEYLKKHLTNEIEWTLDIDDVPMSFPYYSEDVNLRKKLILNKIYIAKYWDGIEENGANINEVKLMNNLIHLPIDQRYNELDMKRIVEVINA